MEWNPNWGVREGEASPQVIAASPPAALSMAVGAARWKKGAEQRSGPLLAPTEGTSGQCWESSGNLGVKSESFRGGGSK